MDIRKVKKLIELLEESGIAELEISEGEESVRISRHPRGTTVNQPMMMAPPMMSAPAPAPTAPLAATATSAPPTPNGHTITAPMVGTYYAAPSPGAKLF